MMEVDCRKRGGELRQRTYDFSLRIINLWKSLPKGTEYEVIGKQLLRCGTSIGANYRAATVGKSDRDFLNKIRICQEEADESCYWLALLADSGMIQAKKLESIRDEANQITAIMTASAITIHKRILAEERNQNIPEKV